MVRLALRVWWGGGGGGRDRAAAAVACLLIAPVLARPGSSSAAPRVAAQQELVALLDAHGVRARADLGTPLLGTVAARRPITGERTVLPVLARAVDQHGRHWVRVLLPGRALVGRPLPRSGWIRSRRAQHTTTAWHILVEIGARRVLVYRAGLLLRAFPAIVGKPSTPTPSGRFFVEENVRLPLDRPGAPFALATSARTQVLQTFDGGPGQIALHGLGNLEGALGTAVSHGCVRVDGDTITWLATRIGPGVPVTVR